MKELFGAPFFRRNSERFSKNPYFRKRDKMLHLDDTTRRQTMLIPRTRTTLGEAYRLLLRNNVNRTAIDAGVPSFNADYSFDFAREGVSFDTGVYYVTVLLNFPTAPVVGEYQYLLMDGEELVSSGLLWVRDAEKEEIEQYEEEIAYEQYTE